MRRSGASSTARDATSAGRSGPSKSGRPYGKRAEAKAAAAELLSIYRRISAGKVRTPEAPEPDPDVPELDVRFGPEPGWSPRHEGGTVVVAVGTSPEGEVATVAVCPRCGSGIGPDPLGRSLACGACLRAPAAHEDRIAAARRRRPDPPREPRGAPSYWDRLESERVAEEDAREDARQAARRAARDRSAIDRYLFRAPPGP